MAKISTIVNKICKQFNIKIKGQLYDNRTVSTVRFLNGDDSLVLNLTPDVLFLGNYERFKECEFSGNCILVGADGAVPIGDSLHIDEKIDLLELSNVVSECLYSDQRLQMKKDALFAILRHGHNMSLMLKKAYSFIENPITICDSSFSILDSYPPVKDDRSLEKRNNRLSLKNVFTNDMQETNLISHIFHSTYPFLTKIDDFEYDWMFESIRINQTVVGYVCIRGFNRDFTEDDLELIHHLTHIISIYLQKGNAYENAHGIKYDRFFKQLFLGYFDNEENIKAQINSFGVNPSGYYYLLAYDFVDSSKNLLSKDYFLQQIQSIFPLGITGTFEGMIVTLLPADKTSPFNNSTRDRLSVFLTMNRMICSISFVFTDLNDAVTYFSQCQSIFTMIDPEKSIGEILRYGNYCLRHIATLLDDPKLFSATIHPAIKFMQKYDATNSTEYLRTLKTYIKNNRSAPAASSELHIHKSTFFYRIEKMKSLFNIDISNPDAMFAYEISLKIMDISKTYDL